MKQCHASKPNHESSMPIAPLTNRELEVLTAAAERGPRGCYRLSMRLAIREEIISRIFERIFEKMQVRSRRKAVLKALRLGLVSPANQPPQMPDQMISAEAFSLLEPASQRAFLATGGKIAS